MVNISVFYLNNSIEYFDVVSIFIFVWNINNNYLLIAFNQFFYFLLFLFIYFVLKILRIKGGLKYNKVKIYNISNIYFHHSLF